MKPFLWFAAAAGTLAVTGLIFDRMLRRHSPRFLAAGPSEVIELGVIEIIPLEVTGPLVTDTATMKLLDELANESLFLK